MNRNNLRVVMEKYGPKIQQAIKQYMEEQDINATGQTAASIYSNVFETVDSIGIAIGGSKSFTVLHTGRRAGLRAPSYIDINTWMKAKNSFKGTKTINSAKNIARAIGRRGIKGKNISYEASLRIMNALLRDSSAAYIKDIESHFKKSTSKNVN